MIRLFFPSDVKHPLAGVDSGHLFISKLFQVKSHEASATAHIKDLDSLTIGHKLLHQLSTMQGIVVSTVKVNRIVLLRNVIVVLLDVILRETYVLLHFFLELFCESL